MTKDTGYRGRATFSGGTITIQDYLPMSADMSASFTVEGGQVHFDRLDLDDYVSYGGKG